MDLSEQDLNIEDSGPLRIYETALGKGQFILQQCQDCKQTIFYPRILCNHCGSSSLIWVDAIGRGTVYSTSVVRLKPEQGDSYNVALIDLEEGPRMMSRVVNIKPEQVKIGMRVEAVVAEIDGKPALLFTPAVDGVS